MTRLSREAKRLREAATHCALCGGLLAPREMDKMAPMARTIDHIVPKAMGGGDEISNLRVAHRKCNAARGDGTGELLEHWRRRARAAEHALTNIFRVYREEAEG